MSSEAAGTPHGGAGLDACCAALASTIERLARENESGWARLVGVRQALGMRAQDLALHVRHLERAQLVEVRPQDASLPTSRYALARVLAREARLRSAL